MFLKVGVVSMSELLRLLMVLGTASSSVLPLFVTEDETLEMLFEISELLLLFGLRRLRCLGSLVLTVSPVGIKEEFCSSCKQKGMAHRSTMSDFWDIYKSVVIWFVNG